MELDARTMADALNIVCMNSFEYRRIAAGCPSLAVKQLVLLSSAIYHSHQMDFISGVSLSGLILFSPSFSPTHLLLL